MTSNLESLKARVFGGAGWNKAFVEGALIHDLWAEVERLRGERDIWKAQASAHSNAIEELQRMVASSAHETSGEPPEDRFARETARYEKSLNDLHRKNEELERGIGGLMRENGRLRRDAILKRDPETECRRGISKWSDGDRFTSLVPQSAKEAASKLRGAFLFHESREREDYWNAIVDRLDELGAEKTSSTTTTEK